MVIPGYWNPYRKDGELLEVVCSSIVALNTKTFTKYLRTHPSKQIDIKRPPEKYPDPSKSHIRDQITCLHEFTSDSFLIGSTGILVIHRSHLESYLSPQHKYTSITLLYQDPSWSIEINQNQSRSIRINQDQSRSIKINQDQSRSIKINQDQSRSIKINQDQSRSIKINLACKGINAINLSPILRNKPITGAVQAS